MKIKQAEVLLPLFLSILFYAELLLISVRSSIIEWIINLFILAGVIFFYKNYFYISIRKVGLVLYCVWVLFSFSLIYVDIVNYIDASWALKHFFSYSIQLPAMACTFYILINKRLYNSMFELISFVFSLLLFLFLKVGFIPEYKYQIVGNISLLTLILVALNCEKPKSVKIVFTTILFLIIIFCGSRQSLIGFLIFLLAIVLKKMVYFFNKNVFIKFYMVLFAGILFSFIKLFNFDILNVPVLTLDEFGLTSISRLISNFSLEESESNYYRIRSLDMLISNFSFLPNGYLYLNEVFFLEPHNFFVEIVFSYGYLMSFCILLFLIYSLYKLFNKHTKIHFAFLVAVFLVPTFVSSGLHAARFFVIFLIAVSIFKNIKYEYTN